MKHIRTACHVHSDWSYDGKWPLEKIAETFSERGYQVVMTTEHDRGFDESRRLEHREACRQASNANILVVPGIEYSDPSNTIHLLVWGDVPFIGEGIDTEKTLDAVKAAGGVVVFAHPSRRQAWKRFEPAWKNKILGIELWNRKTDGWAPSLDAGPLIEASGALPFVGMDFHSAKQLFPLATIIEIDSQVSEAALLASMKSGRCVSEAFGRPVESLSAGPGVKALRTAEFMRRKAAALYHKTIA
jgi:hypothetical protein